MQKKPCRMQALNTAAGCLILKLRKCLQSIDSRRMCPVARMYAPCPAFLRSGLLKHWPAASPDFSALERCGALFTPGKDFRYAQNGEEMKALMQQVIQMTSHGERDDNTRAYKPSSKNIPVHTV